MASPYKIPKKKQSEGDDSPHLHVHSPLSRLHNTAAHSKSSWDDPRRGSTDRMRAGNGFGTDRMRAGNGFGADRMHAGNASGSGSGSHRSPLAFKRVVLNILELDKTASAKPSANQRTGQCITRSMLKSQPEQGHTSSSPLSNGWRPKRASDRLNATEQPSPPTKRSSSEVTASARSNQSVSVGSVDILAELRDEGRSGNLSPSPSAENRWRWSESQRDRTNQDSPEIKRKTTQLKRTPSSGASSDQDFESPPPPRNKTPEGKIHPTKKCSFSFSYVLSMPLVPRKRSDKERSLKNDLRDDQRETERDRWREFRDRKTYSRSLSSRLRLKRPKQTSSSSEPIVLSSEEEDECEDEGGGEKMRSESDSQPEEVPHPENLNSGSGSDSGSEKKQEDQAGEMLRVSGAKGGEEKHSEWCPFIQLAFTSLHAGLTHADANGKIMITQDGIAVPLKGVEGNVTVVASQVRGYGLWDGGVVQGGTLLADWEGPAPSVLFLWVTEAQAKLLHRELSVIQPDTINSPWCAFLLLVLKEQLQELQTAKLYSILDMEEYRKSSSSSSGGPCSPLDWADGQLLFHSCPPPLDQHLFSLLQEKRNQTKTSPRQTKSSLPSTSLQQLPSRLIQYPPPPCKGRITVTKEDLDCLDIDEYLNDVIIDFYLKYLLLEGVGGATAERSHVFSSFFYKQLSRRRAAGEDDRAFVPDRHMRHQRVTTWTRHVDIFAKDFLFVPVNQVSHWYLVVVCFPGLEEAQHEEFQVPVREQDRWLKSPKGGAERAGGRRAFSLRSQQPPECTQQGWQKETVLKRPCILVMDSLKLTDHENVCKLLRDYLQVEWEVRRGTPRLFTPDSMRSSKCRVLLQDNGSDCGVYLLQYVESFLQNPVVNFDLPLKLENWFPRQQVRQKREKIRDLVMKLHKSQR